ncbi:mucin-3A-like isoform X2 [Physella acuta]|uniref:mucin-3A-like isoform X2 n=1 Tax=Physella acuta TaxID=109671 RepID=UPI0027DBF501|nr:mucin-3A-like isoform X2 [Physella acuta]
MKNRFVNMWTWRLLLLGALWEYTGATSCTDLTKKTCTPTLQVTGTCTNSVCDCKSGLVSTRTGCSGVVQPKIGIVPHDGTNYAASSIGSGEVYVGKDIKLVCNPNYGNGVYAWTHNNNPVPNEANRELILTSVTATMTGNYRCQIRFPTGDFETALSESVLIKVIDGLSGNNFAILPQVVGMPARAFSSATFTLKCVTIPSGLLLTYQWVVGGTDSSGATSDTFPVTQPGSSTTYSCRVGTTDNITPATGIPATSAVVNSPSTVSLISGVFLSSVDPANLPADPNGPRPDVPPVISAEVGGAVQVYCAVNDTDIAISTATYVWQKDGGTITGSGNSYSKSNLVAGDTGSYTCVATVGGTPYTSRAVRLNVESKIIDSVDLVVIPTTPVLTGYAVLDCQVKIADLRRVNYTWTKNSITMPNITDRALQINNLVASDNTAYACTASVGLDSASDSITLSAPALGSATPAVTSKSTIFGVGNKYTLTCGEDYTIPGLTYRWYEDDNIVSGQTSKTYELTVKAGTKVYKCDIALGTTISSKSTPGLTVAANPFSAVNINVGTIKLDTTYQPLTATSVTLTCVATMAAGATGTVTYSWTKDSGATGSGTSTLTFTAGAATNGAYKCKATLDSGNLESPEVTVTAAASLSAPTIGTTADRYSGDQKSYSEGADYELTCESSSYSPDMQFVWTKDTVNVGTSRVYKITNANKVSSGGSFTCSVTLGTSTVTSAAVTITIGEKGKPCEFVNDCDGDQYDDVCLSNRCVCATGYALTGNTCSGQGIVTISMLLLVLCGLIKLIL